MTSTMPLWIGPLAVFAAALVVSFILYLTAGAPLREMNPNLGTRTFLILLRLAIGWHFLVEGLEKVQERAWTSGPALRASTGPYSSFFRDLAGAPAVDRLELQPDGNLAAPLEADLEREYQAFVNNYDLTLEQQKEAKLKFDQARAELKTWIAKSSKDVDKYETGPYKMSVADRIDHYEATLAKVNHLEKVQIPLYGEDYFDEYKSAVKELNLTYAGLAKDLQDRTEVVKGSLRSVLTPEQLAKEPPPPAEVPVEQWSLLQWTDLAVSYGLVVIGGCLILGLLTRPAAFFGALMMAVFYFWTAPVPGWPEQPRAEGSYVYVNKMLIEMLALSVITCTHSGRWLGLDGLVQFLWPWRWFRRRAEAAA